MIVESRQLIAILVLILLNLISTMPILLPLCTRKGSFWKLVNYEDLRLLLDDVPGVEVVVEAPDSEVLGAELDGGDALGELD